MYLAHADFRWIAFLVKLAVLAGTVYYFGLAILVMVIAVLAVLWLLSKILPTGFLSTLATQVIGFMLTRSLMGPMATVPVRDVRVRDASGQETLVRLKGQLTSGSVSVGDDITAEGWLRNGMLLFRRGYNNRIRAEIKVKPQ
jgi:hypothetical protein